MRKKFLAIILLAALLLPQLLSAKKWTAQSNEDLYADFLEFTEAFQRTAKEGGYAIADDLALFIAELEAVSTKSPYAWIKMSHRFISDQICRYAPGLDEPYSKEPRSIIRRNLLKMRDFPMHSNDVSDFFEPYVSEARNSFLKWLDTPAPAEGSLQIFKIYNMGYCLRTSKHVVIFDLVWDGTVSEMDYIASKADILLLSHPHHDHYTKEMLEAMVRAGKYVVLPQDLIPGSKSSAKIVKTVSFNEMDLDGVSVRGFIGQQSGDPCFVYVIDFDGWRFAHAGDNQTKEAEAYLAQIEALDVLTIAVWAKPQVMMGHAMKAPGADKRETVFLSSHENEKLHTPDGRIGFNQAYDETDKFGSVTFNYPPLVIWECGECITLTK